MSTAIESAITLRPYQAELVANTLDVLATNNTALAVMPTGCGKTVCFSFIAREKLREGRVLLVAHRDELIYQGARALREITGEDVAIEKGESYAIESLWGRARIVATSVQTMSRPRRLQRFRPEDFALIIIDEAHHATARTYRTVINHFCGHDGCKLLGVTATPDRGDEESLGQIFGVCAYDYQLPQAIADGWLVPIRQMFVEVAGLDLSQVHSTAGDLSAGELDELLSREEYAHQIALPTIEQAGDQRALVFTAGVAQADMLAEIINRHKPGRAAAVNGETDSEIRRKTLVDFREGRLQFLCNCGVFLEGFDEPRIGVVSMARPTKSRALYAQAVGRGTRTWPGIVDGLDTAEERRAAIAASLKPSVLVLDFVGNAGRHQLVSTRDILDGVCTLCDADADVVLDRAVAAVREASARGESLDMADEIKQQEIKLRQERIEQAEEQERRRRDKFRPGVRYALGEISAFAFYGVTERREAPWFKGRQPTARQLEVLRKAGVPLAGLTFQKASQTIDGIMKRRDQGLCSFKQARLLAKRGHADAANYTREQAAEALDAIARREGWRSKN